MLVLLGLKVDGFTLTLVECGGERTATKGRF
jgi:hypothetical protein